MAPPAVLGPALGRGSSHDVGPPGLPHSPLSLPKPPHHGPGPGLGRSQAPAASPSHYFVSRFSLSICSLPLGSAHGPLDCGLAFRLLPYLMGLFPRLRPQCYLDPVTLSPAPAPGSSHSSDPSQAPPTALVWSWAALTDSVPPSSPNRKSPLLAGGPRGL